MWLLSAFLSMPLAFIGSSGSGWLEPAPSQVWPWLCCDSVEEVGSSPILIKLVYQYLLTSCGGEMHTGRRWCIQQRGLFSLAYLLGTPSLHWRLWDAMREWTKRWWQFWGCFNYCIFTHTLPLFMAWLNDVRLCQVVEKGTENIKSKMLPLSVVILWWEREREHRLLFCL